MTEDQICDEGRLVGYRVDEVTSYRLLDSRFTGMYAVADLSGPVLVCTCAIPDDLRQLLTDVRDALAHIEGRVDAAVPGIVKDGHHDHRA